MNTRQAYENWADTYDADRNLTRDLDQIVTRQVLANQHCTWVLEIGCGTGKNTPALTQIAEWVFALDLAPGMLKQAKAKLSPVRVLFAIADLTKAWPCKDRFTELVVCNLVLEHIQDLSFIFSEANRVLTFGGRFFVCELHPFRQYQGIQAHFLRGPETIEVPAFVHHVSDFINSAAKYNFALEDFNEWWHEEDQDKLPRLVSFLFVKGSEVRALAGLE